MPYKNGKWINNVTPNIKNPSANINPATVHKEGQIYNTAAWQNSIDNPVSAPVSPPSSQGQSRATPAVPQYNSFAPQPLPQSKATAATGGESVLPTSINVRPGQIPTPYSTNVPANTAAAMSQGNQMNRASELQRAAAWNAPEGQPYNPREALTMLGIAAIPTPGTAEKSALNLADKGLTKMAQEYAMGTKELTKLKTAETLGKSKFVQELLTEMTALKTKALGQKLTPNLERELITFFKEEHLSKTKLKIVLEEAPNTLREIEKYGTKLSALPHLYWERWKKILSMNAVAIEAKRKTSENLNKIYDAVTSEKIKMLADNKKTSYGQIEKRIKANLLLNDATEGMKKGLEKSGFLKKHYGQALKAALGITAGAVAWQVSGDLNQGMWEIIDNSMTSRSMFTSQLYNDLQWKDNELNPIDAYNEVKDWMETQKRDQNYVKQLTRYNPRSWTKIRTSRTAAQVQTDQLNYYVGKIKEMADDSAKNGLKPNDKMVTDAKEEIQTWVDSVKSFMEEHPEGQADTGQFAPEDFTNVSTAPNEKDKLYWQENQLIENKQARETKKTEQENRKYYAGQRQLDEDTEKEMRTYYEKRLTDEAATEKERQDFWLKYQADKEAYWEEYKKKKEENAPSKLGFGLL